MTLKEYFDCHPEETTDTFARRCGLKYSTIANLRTGRCSCPTVLQATTIARATNNEVPISSWVGGEDER